MWLACRTDPDAPAHKGISIIIVPADAEGIQITKIHPLGEHNVYAVYYDNVRVPIGNVVGGENNGWHLITTQLNHERVALCSVGPLEKLCTETIEWAKQTPNGDGGMIIDLPWVKTNLARVYAKLEVLKLLNWQQGWSIARDTLSPADASAIKVFGTEFYVEGPRLLMEVHGAAGVLHRGSEGAALRGQVEKYYRMVLLLTYGGGTNEIQRDIICQAGLRMPRLGRR
jgi:alkylation response protein AidB-like acyl-CoA dehydrogenase